MIRYPVVETKLTGNDSLIAELSVYAELIGVGKGAAGIVRLDIDGLGQC